MSTISCQNSLGHESCGHNPTIEEREGHKADTGSWSRSKNLVYRRKIARQMKGKK